MARKKPSTIYDVAHLAEVSIATVSRVFNAPHKVNPATRKAVLAAVDELEYVPHETASSRAKTELGRIGIISPYFTAPAFVQRLRGISAVFASAKYELIVYAVESDVQLQEYLHVLPVSNRLDGLIVISLEIDDDTVTRLKKNRLETVIIETSNNNFSAVSVDNYNGGRMVGEYLLQRGYKSFGFIGEVNGHPYSIYPTRERFRGFSDVLSGSGFNVDTAHIIETDFRLDEARTSIREYLQNTDFPDVIFASTDMQAIALIKAAQDLGISIPDRLAVIGFDDIDAADFMDLTTVRQHLDASGRLAAEILIRRMRDPERPREETSIPFELIQRRTA
jgi:DNA-binding LacI/PurR family transcriptional regulator